MTQRFFIVVEKILVHLFFISLKAICDKAGFGFVSSGFRIIQASEVAKWHKLWKDEQPKEDWQICSLSILIATKHTVYRWIVVSTGFSLRQSVRLVSTYVSHLAMFSCFCFASTSQRKTLQLTVINNQNMSQRILLLRKIMALRWWSKSISYLLSTNHCYHCYVWSNSVSGRN